LSLKNFAVHNSCCVDSHAPKKQRIQSVNSKNYSGSDIVLYTELNHLILPKT